MTDALARLRAIAGVPEAEADMCARCGRCMYQRGTVKSLRPVGWVGKGSNGKCATCYRKARMAIGQARQEVEPRKWAARAELTREAVALKASGRKQWQIAAALNCSRATVVRVLREDRDRREEDRAKQGNR